MDPRDSLKKEQAVPMDVRDSLSKERTVTMERLWTRGTPCRWRDYEPEGLPVERANGDYGETMDPMDSLSKERMVTMERLWT